MNEPNEPETTGLGALLAALAALPEYDAPLVPIFAALEGERPLTLRAIRRHSAVLQACTADVREQTFAVNRMIVSCQQIPPIPLPCLPLGF